MRILLTLALALLALPAADAGLAVTNLSCEHLREPTGLGTLKPRLSWQLESTERGKAQSSYRILAARSLAALEKDEGDLWDSGKRKSSSCYLVFYQGKDPLVSGQQVFWKVRVWDEKDEESNWSAPASFTMGILDDNEWKAEWISFKDETPLHRIPNKLHLPPTRYYRKTFDNGKKIKRALAFASALGIYELRLNGKKVGDAALSPGWTDYRERVYYNSYDVTGHLHEGLNCLGAIVADGWYAGYVGPGKRLGFGPYKTGRNIYGKTPALLVQLHLEYEDGSSELIATDAGWKVSTGPEFEADLLMGEGYDAQKELPGWDTAAYDADAWEDAIPASMNQALSAPFHDKAGSRTVDLGFIKPRFLQGYPAPPVRVTHELPAKLLSEPSPETYIFDFGQNFTGNVRLKVTGEKGQKITMRYAELLHPDGRMMTDPDRAKRATDTYVCKGDPAGESWSPRFTLHTFRFVELSGLRTKPSLDALTGLVTHSDTRLTSGFECSDPVATRIFQNTVWTQRSNWVEIPSTSLQRDERLGGTAAAQSFARAACYHVDNAAFFRKWFRELSESRAKDGFYPSSAPFPFADERMPHSSGWSDAGILCTYAVWWMYGDEELVKEQWVPMKKYLQARRDAYLDSRGRIFGSPRGDRQNLNDSTPVGLIDLCYLALDCRLMGEMARIAGNPIEHLNYNKWFGEVQQAFRKQYVNGDGSLKVNSQTAHVLALRFGLLTDLSKKKVTENLLALLKSKSGPASSGMTTGFLGTKALLPVLTWTGNHDAAVRLVQSRKFPSWGYAVEQGATTLWDSWGPQGKNRGVMDSHSDHSFGAVSEWMMAMLAGIDAAFPGFQRIRLEPWIPSQQAADGIAAISWVRAHYDSCRGRIAVHWQVREDGSLLYECTIPVQTSAVVSLPAQPDSVLLVDGMAPGKDRQFDGGFLLENAKGRASFNVLKSGTYRFEVK